MSGSWDLSVAVTISVKRVTTGVPISYQVKPSDTGMDLKTQIQIKDGYPIDQQRLSIGNFQIKDAQTMFEVGVEEGSVVSMTLKLRGD